MKKRFLLIAQPNSYRIAPYLKAADKMGLSVLIASQGKHSLITEVHDGLHIDLDDFSVSLDTILNVAKDKPFAGILGSDDSTVELAAAASEKLGLAHNPPTAARLSRRKDLARAHLALANCPVPVHCLINLTQELKQQLQGLAFPCVVKPLNMSASRGVIRVDNETEFIVACNRIKNIIAESSDAFERTHVLVEEYIDGIEIAFEGYLHRGKLNTLTIFDKPDPLTGPYFEETIYVTPSSLDKTMQNNIHAIVEQACAAYGLSTGPIHAEFRIDENGKAWILEIASRTIGGECGKTLNMGDELNLEVLTIILAMGEEPEHFANVTQSKGVMMIPIQQAGLLKRTEGILAAQKVKNIDSIVINIPTGHELVPLPEGNQYLGYIFATAPTNDKVIAAIKAAHDLLTFVVAPIWQIKK